MESRMRVVLGLCVLFAIASCQAVPSRVAGPAGGAAGPEALVPPAQVQSDVAAILKGMDQARVEGLRRAGQ
jgi:hypothetical protein